MRAFLLAFLAILTFQTTSFSQISFWHNNKLAVEAKERTLVVELRKKYSAENLSKEDREAYFKKVDDYNELTKRTFEKYWDAHSDIIFKTYSEIEELAKNDREGKYVYFIYNKWDNQNPSSGPDPYSYTLKLAKRRKIKQYHNEIVSLNTGYKANNDVDYGFVVYTLNKYYKAYAEDKKSDNIELYNKEKNYKILTEKTLLFDIEMLDTTDITVEKAREIYPHKIKFVTANKIYEAAQRKDPNSLYMTYIFNSPFRLWMHAIVDAKTMEIVAMQPPNRTYFGIGRQFEGGDVTSVYKEARLGVAWLSRAKIKLKEKDFIYLGTKVTVDKNHR